MLVETSAVDEGSYVWFYGIRQGACCCPGVENFYVRRSISNLSCFLSAFFLSLCMRLWQVDSSCLGVESLTKRLVSLLTVRIKDALPNMKWELQESLSECPLFSPFLPPYLGRPAWAVLLGPCERTTPRTEQNRTEPDYRLGARFLRYVLGQFVPVCYSLVEGRAAVDEPAPALVRAWRPPLFVLNLTASPVSCRARRC